MNFELVKGWVFTVLSVLVIAAATVLVIMQSSRYVPFSLYGQPPRDVSLALLMLLSAVGGVAVLVCVALLFRGIVAIRGGKRTAKIDQAIAASKQPPTA